MIKETYKVSYWYCGYQVKDEATNCTLEEAIKIKERLTAQNKINFVHYEIHKDNNNV